MQNARITAINALIKMENDDAYSNIVIDTALTKSGLNRLDSAFASTLFYGVLERRITLDYALQKYMKKPLEQTDITVLTVLRAGIYQLKFMDKVPDSAAVDESVKCCVALKKHNAKGFVNAVLRSFIRDGKKIAPPKDDLQMLSVKYSVPEWLVKSYIADYGRDNAEKIMSAFLRKKALSVRVNTTKISCADFIDMLGNKGITAKESPICKNAVIIDNPGAVKSLCGYNDGLFHVQDVASQLTAAALEIGGNDTVLDVCAAPGGKTFTMAQQTSGTVLSCDLYPHKVRLIEQGAERLGLDNVKALVNDASKHNETLGSFNKILCDLPCSGLGILCKKPEIRYKNVTFVDKLPKLQYDLLLESAKYASVGSVLLYSTCTLRHAENGQVANKFLQNNPDFEPLSILPNIKRGIDEPSNQLTLLPHIHGTDGFFMACFKKVR